MSQALANLANKALEEAVEARKTAEDAQASLASLHARIQKLEDQLRGQTGTSRPNR